MDFRFSENDLDNQSRFSIGIGVGAKYHFSNFQIFINPDVRRYLVIPFEEKQSSEINQFWNAGRNWLPILEIKSVISKKLYKETCRFVFKIVKLRSEI